jgi:hypothetical protein
VKYILKALWFVGPLGLVSLLPAATMTMNGMISDSMCGVSHAKMMAAHPNIKTDRACTLGCVKAGAKYVFVSDGKVYQITNQELASLRKDAGESVSVTGDVNGDTITVSKMMMEKQH